MMANMKRFFRNWQIGLCLAGGVAAGIGLGSAGNAAPLGGDWKKHIVQEGFRTATAAAGDFDGDGRMDVVVSNGGKIRLFLGPDGNELVLHAFAKPNYNCIHSEVLDVDGDGDLDYLGASWKGPVFWLENPGAAKLADGPWTYRVADDEIEGIHCLLKADVDNDGKLELLVNNFQPKGALGDSLMYLSIPADPHRAGKWKRNVFAAGDAPGGSHYFGFGDVDGDGWGEIAVGAKGKPFENGNWFAYWKNPGKGKTDQPWEKVVIAENQIAATNILPADLNGDGKTDFLASRGHGHGVLWFEAPDWTPHEIDAEIEGPHSLAVADFDQDGDMDGASCGKDSRWVTWYENDGKGKFTLHRIDLDQAAYDIRAVDMDGDGDADLLLGGQLSKNVVWYENPLK